MRSRQKGFDPLSSLFESADLPVGTPLPAVDDGPDPSAGGRARHVELTDPLFRTPPDLPGPSTPREQAPPAPSPRALRSDFPVTVGPAPEAMPDEVEEPPSTPPPEAPPVVAPPVVARAVSAAEKAAIAKAVARAAAKKAAPPAAPKVPPKAVAKVPAPAVTAQPEAEKKGWQATRNLSRIDALAAQARRPAMSAVEAARTAARAEAADRKALAPPSAAVPRATMPAAPPKRQETKAPADHPVELTDLVQALIPRALPNVGPIYVANAIITDQRDVLSMLWRAHRTKFTGDGQLERAVGAAAVLHALESVPDGELVAAHVVTDASDYLVWMDIGSNSLVAAFSDARAYFATGT